MWERLWQYPYRLGIGIFVAVVTALLTLFFIGVTAWLEQTFKKEREGK